MRRHRATRPSSWGRWAGRRSWGTWRWPARTSGRACQTDLSADTATELAEFVLDHGGEEEEALAEHWLVQALSLNGAHGRARHCLGRLQQSRGQLHHAFHSMLSAMRACPTDEYILFETAELAAEIGNVALCLSILAQLEALASSDHYWLDRARMFRAAR